ncbi:MAG: efflux transporter outer membrane subunit, partial [Pyrinomonadaceae bacterium]|nr:efflux transporter outer membrane subunit [Phycisphaerales bacterium]
MKQLPGNLQSLLARAYVGTLAIVVAGCTVGPDYSQTTTVVPPRWGELPDENTLASEAEALTSRPTSGPPSIAEWWTTFHDPALDSLIHRAIGANLDLRAAQARVREARAQRGVVSAELFPTVDARGSYSRSRASENSFTGGSVGTPAGTEGDLYRVGFDASWEIDVFGGVRRNVEAADADIAASIEDRRDVLITLLAEVAQNYIELRGFQRRAAIARTNLETQAETLKITGARVKAGLASDLDVARAEAQVQTTESQIPSLDSAARRSIHILSVLLAKHPTALSEELSAIAPIPAAPPQVPIGLPSDLLRRRPDIRRAERQLAAATARIGVATADLFPRFSLVGSLGLESSQFDSVGDSSSGFWSIGPSVSWPILDFGRIRSNIDVRTAREEQGFVAYERVVLVSLREVEDALVAFMKEQARHRSLNAATESNRRAANLAKQLYQDGLSDFLSVLQAQRDLFESEDAIAQSDLAITTNLVSLYKALGGGWEVEARGATTTNPP